jgi:hypothetical protein
MMRRWIIVHLVWLSERLDEALLTDDDIGLSEGSLLDCLRITPGDHAFLDQLGASW